MNIGIGVIICGLLGAIFGSLLTASSKVIKLLEEIRDSSKKQ